MSDPNHDKAERLLVEGKAYAAGFRAALATVVPLLVAQVFHLSGGTWMSLAGFSGALADGGAYDTRAVTIASLTAFGAIAVFVGGGASHTLTTAVVLTFAVALVCSLGRAWGNNGAIVGGSVLNMFVISLAYPAATLAEALGRSGYTIIGGVWAALIALVLWPIRPYRPARLAVARRVPQTCGLRRRRSSTRSSPNTWATMTCPPAASPFARRWRMRARRSPRFDAVDLAKAGAANA